MHEDIGFEELGSDRVFELPELQERADRNPWDSDRKQYRAALGGKDVAFFTFDVSWPDELNLYEVFVAKEYRQCGVGTAILRFAADLGRQLGIRRLTIRARPLSEQSQKDLIAWYVRRGLTVVPKESEVLELNLSEST